MSAERRAPAPAGATALIDQVRACTAEISAYWVYAAAWDLPPAPDLAAAYNYTVTDLMAARALLFRAQALLMAIETVTS